VLVFLHQLGYGSRWERDVLCRFRGMSFADLEGIVLVFLHQLGYGSRWERDINPAQDHPADGCNKFVGHCPLIDGEAERSELRGAVSERNQHAGGNEQSCSPNHHSHGSANTCTNIGSANTCTQTADGPPTTTVVEVW